jgi:hypothetical protein
MKPSEQMRREASLTNNTYEANLYDDWAKTIVKLERVARAVGPLLSLIADTTDERGLPYIFPYADEIKEAKEALKEVEHLL